MNPEDRTIVISKYKIDWLLKLIESVYYNKLEKMKFHDEYAEQVYTELYEVVRNE